MKKASSLYIAALSDELRGQPVYLYWKGRVALYALLKALDIGPGDEVVVPAYTCVVVPNAIMYLGAKPIYVDINLQTFNVGASGVRSAISPKTKAIICQNTYGLSVELEEICEIATEFGITTIEDCTHGFGGTYNGQPNGVSCDAAIFSTQWNKPHSTGIGGFATTKNENIKLALERTNKELIAPNLMETLQLRCLVAARHHLLNEKSYWTLVKLYRWLSSKNFVVGSSSPVELGGVSLPANYFKGHTTFQSNEGLKGLKSLQGTIQRRTHISSQYTDFLSGLGKNCVEAKYNGNHSFLKYPLLVNDRTTFQQIAENNRIVLGEWFTSPLHPVEGNLDRWHLNIRDFPTAGFAARHVVNLPTTPNSIDNVIGFLSENRSLLIDAKK